MRFTGSSLGFAVVAALALAAGCGDESPVGPSQPLVLHFVPNDAVIDANRSRLYLNRRLGASVWQIDYATMSVLDSIPLSTSPGFMDLGDNGLGLELYVPVRGGVDVYEAESLVKRVSINTGLATSVVIDGRGLVFASIGPAYEYDGTLASPLWDRPVRAHLRADGHYISGGGHYEHCRIRILPNGGGIIGITTIVGPVDMEYYRFDSDGNFVSYCTSPYHGDHPMDPRIYRVSPGGQFVITSAYGAIYTADSTMTYVGQLSTDSALFTDFAFDVGGNTIFAAVGNERRIDIFEYPTLWKTGSIDLEGYPNFVFRDGDRLVLLARPSLGEFKSRIEVIRIP